MYKNIASQKLAVYAYDTVNNTGKTGDAANITAQISKDGAGCAATNDVNPTELDAVDAPGIYLFDLTQAETNGGLVVLYAKSSTANIELDLAIIYTKSLEAKLASDGLDNISTTEPSGVASNFREMLVQTWRRRFKKDTATKDAIKTYKDDGSVATTQVVTFDGATKTVDNAS